MLSVSFQSDGADSIILFVYGLVFFVLGLAALLQSRHYSRLDLARSLSWLAAFGFAHSLHEWGDLFIATEAAGVSTPVTRVLTILQLVLLAVSFACLFEFGVSLLQPLGRSRWLHGVPLGLLLVWLFGVFFVLLPFLPDPVTWRRSANALARYGIGFPGGLAAAYGLRQQAIRRIALLNVPHIVSMLRVAGWALVIYAIFSGLVPPPVPFFPGNLLNTVTVRNSLGIPAILFRSVIGFALVMAMIRALEVFDVEIERMIEGMEQQQILATEQERIGRELHDGAIQTVYTAGLLVESARSLAEPESVIASRLDKAIDVLHDAIQDLRRNLGELQAAPSDVALPVALRRLAEDARYGSLVHVAVDIQIPDVEEFPPARVGHVLSIVHEALSNAVRHARARQVLICAQQENGRLVVTIHDDGRGLSPHLVPGFGLRNMRDRARLLGGQVEVTGPKGKGTTVRLDIPWKDER